MSNRCPMMSCRAEDMDGKIVWIDCLENDCALWYEKGKDCSFKLMASCMEQFLDRTDKV